MFEDKVRSAVADLEELAHCRAALLPRPTI
jgi:hypothetical protein